MKVNEITIMAVVRTAVTISKMFAGTTIQNTHQSKFVRIKKFETIKTVIVFCYL